MSIIGPLPYNLQNGNEADAVQVMANYDYIISQVNANAAALSSLGALAFEDQVNLNTQATGSVNASLVQYTPPGVGGRARSVQAVFNDGPISVKDYGASGSAQITAGSMSAGSSTLSLVSALDFANGQGIRINNAGAAYALGQPGSLTVIPVGSTGSTAYAYTVAAIDGYGGVSAAIALSYTGTGSATLSVNNYNALSWSAVAGATSYAVYGRTSGGLLLLAVVSSTSWNDQGTGATVGPDWVPALPPVSSSATWLVTSVLSGGGTTTLVLADAAVSAPSGSIVMHDDTAAIQACVNTITPNSTGYVFVPAGYYCLTGAILINEQGTRIIGAGQQVSWLYHVTTDSTTFRVISSVDYFEVKDLGVKHASVATAGFVFQTEISGILGGLVERVLTIGVFGVAKNTITLGSVNNVWFKDCLFLATVFYGIWLQFTVDWVIDNCIVQMASNASGDCLVVESSNDGLYADKSLFLNGQTGLLCQNSISGGVGSRDLFFNMCSWDGAGLNAFSTTDLRRTRFVQCWFASVYNTCNGAVINGANNYALMFSACMFLNLAGNGIVIEGGASRIDILGNYFVSWGVAAAGTYSGIITAANASTSFNIIGNRFYSDSDFSGHCYNGITIGSGTYATYMVANNVGDGLANVLISDSGTSTTAVVSGNPGYNPVGPVSVSLSASPWTYTAGHSPETLYVVSDDYVETLSVGGSAMNPVRLGANIPMAISLDPNATAVVIYAGTLYAKKFVH